MRRYSEGAAADKTTYQDICLQNSREIAQFFSPVTVRFPRNLVKAVVEPVTEIGSCSSPWLVVQRIQIDFQYRTSVKRAD